MDSQQLLNQIMERYGSDNVRTKNSTYYDTLAIVAAQQLYNFFVQPLANPFVNNKQLPLAGSEIFFCQEISAYLRTSDNLPIVSITDLDLLLNRSYLRIDIGDRMFYKCTLGEILNFFFADQYGTAVLAQVKQNTIKKSRKFTRPLLFNSTNQCQVYIELDPTVSTAGRQFVGDFIRLEFQGLQFDKLDTFYYDAIKNCTFDMLDFTMYNSRLGVVGAAATQLFNNNNLPVLEFSKNFPLSSDETFQIEAIEICHVTSVSLVESMNILHNNILGITVNDVNLLNADVRKMLYLLSQQTDSFDNVAGTDANTVLRFDGTRLIYVLETPILVPAQAQQSVVYQQETGYATWYSVNLLGTLTRTLK